MLIRGGHVLSMDPAVGDFAKADILVNGRLIEAVGPNLAADGAEVIDASGMIVMPGFVDTHHPPFEPALRDGKISAQRDYWNGAKYRVPNT